MAKSLSEKDNVCRCCYDDDDDDDGGGSGGSCCRSGWDRVAWLLS
jgi:hypothetical protein